MYFTEPVLYFMNLVAEGIMEEVDQGELQQVIEETIALMADPVPVLKDIGKTIAMNEDRSQVAAWFVKTSLDELCGGRSWEKW